MHATDVRRMGMWCRGGLGDGCMGCEDPSTFFAHAGTGNACGSRAVSQWPPVPVALGLVRVHTGLSEGVEEASAQNTMGRRDSSP